MTFNWICVTFALLLALCSSTWAAPSGEHGSKFDELERTLKELATTVLAMNGAGLGGGAGVGDEIGIDIGGKSFPFRISSEHI
ncbi:hypothetical protein KR044_007698 [Drosophila immigrans]|nr:hypothetical protein KR044_007698 [Drosophila immigrans]